MKTTYKAFIEVRSQHSKGSSRGRFGGPDTYVAVQAVPEGAERLKVLNHKIASMRGIKIIHCGEGYYNRQQTSRSMFCQALETAKSVADRINSGDLSDI